jgi:hypothetical protein
MYAAVDQVYMRMRQADQEVVDLFQQVASNGRFPQRQTIVWRDLRPALLCLRWMQICSYRSARVVVW